MPGMHKENTFDIFIPKAVIRVIRGQEFSLQNKMRLGPATQAALLSRMLPTVVFRQGRKIIVTALRRATGCDANLRLSPQVFEIQRSHPALEEDFGGGRNARAPAHWT